MTRSSHATHPARAPAVARATPRTPQRPVANYHRETVARAQPQQAVAQGRFAGGGPAHAVPSAHYGSFERTIRPGVVSRTFVSGGQSYTRVYQQHVWHQFGRSFAYETFVPAVRYPVGYYAWALAPWPRPVTFAWGWGVQPWYGWYGGLFRPYVVYTSPDLWMTDYIIAQNMQAAYQAQMAVPPPPSAPGTYAEYAAPQPMDAPPAVDPNAAAPAGQLGDAAPAPLSPLPPDAAPAAQPGDLQQAPQPGDAPPAPQPGEVPTGPVTPPPAITPQIKAQLNAQIKVQLREQQAAAATPATVTNDSTPPALRPNHVFFEVVQPIDVPSGTAQGYCSLRANDYIKRIGGVSEDDWKIPVVVELSGPSDCPKGLHTRIGLNDLNAMENEQEARVVEAMQAASKSMGPNGPSASPAAHPDLIADASAAPLPPALDAFRRPQ